MIMRAIELLGDSTGYAVDWKMLEQHYRAFEEGQRQEEELKKNEALNPHPEGAVVFGGE